MSVKAVAFDYGGVIAFFQDEAAINDMANIAGADTALLRKTYWDTRSSYDEGLVDGAGFFKAVLLSLGIAANPATLEQLIVRDLKSWSRVNPESEALVRDLKKAGVKLGVLSNMVDDFLQRVKDTLPVFKMFDESVFSCDVKMIKPDEKIYRLLLSRLGCEPDELVFFDDVEINVKAASSMGIHAFLWQDPEVARQELESLGVKLERLQN
jgi:putative hydrolase of the HAD superfamily